MRRALVLGITFVGALVIGVGLLFYFYGPPSMWRYSLLQVKRLSPNIPVVEKKILGLCGLRYGSNDMPVTTIYRCPNGFLLIRRCCDAPGVYLDSAGEFISESCGQLPPGLLFEIKRKQCDIAHRTIVPEGKVCSYINLCTGQEGPAD